MSVNKVPGKVYFYPGNDAIVRGNGLYYLDPTDPTNVKNYFDNTAVVRATLYDEFENPIAWATDKALSFVTGSVGNFAGIVEAPSDARVGTGYTLVITGVQAASKSRFGIDAEVVAERTS